MTRPDGARKAGIADRIVSRIQRWTVRRDIAAGQWFSTLHQRPKRAAQFGTWPEPDIALPPMAVVMQGPIATQDDFTLETLKLYTRTLPSCRLILSTWEDCDPALLAPIAALGVGIVLSAKPANPGMFNVNMQIVSAAAGVRRAVGAGAQWVLKTRTDQRLHDPNVMAFLLGLARTFPVGGATAQRSRIIGVGQGSLKFAPYHVTDQTVFGHADDMLLYWTPPLREDSFPAHWPRTAAEVFAQAPIGEECRLAAPESYLASRFLERIGRPPDWTMADSWAAYRDHFCFADYAATDFYWVKGQSYSLREIITRYDMVSNRHEMCFREWLLLYSGLLPCEAANRYQDAVFATRHNDPVPPGGAPPPAPPART